ncbi:MAG: hypothetical protein JNM57_16965 [Cyclobacteriaceae bacterium]|nr:hypothetical protein [Cyclobacteriaceae bacterium]
MILTIFFKYLSLEKQINVLKKRGINLGSRIKDGRKIYIYMLNNLFVEVSYQHDRDDSTPEKLTMLSGLKNLNNYLEKEFKASF